jgi:hypothetical protein
MPDHVTLWEWEQRDESFRSMSTRARELGARAMADEVRGISDAELATHEEIGRARLRMHARQWLSAKYKQQFADKAGQTQIKKT